MRAANLLVTLGEARAGDRRPGVSRRTVPGWRRTRAGISSEFPASPRRTPHRLRAALGNRPDEPVPVVSSLFAHEGVPVLSWKPPPRPAPPRRCRSGRLHRRRWPERASLENLAPCSASAGRRLTGRVPLQDVSVATYAGPSDVFRDPAHQ